MMDAIKEVTIVGGGAAVIAAELLNAIKQR